MTRIIRIGWTHTHHFRYQINLLSGSGATFDFSEITKVTWTLWDLLWIEIIEMRLTDTDRPPPFHFCPAWVRMAKSRQAKDMFVKEDDEKDAATINRMMTMMIWTNWSLKEKTTHTLWVWRTSWLKDVRVQKESERVKAFVRPCLARDSRFVCGASWPRSLWRAEEACYFYRFLLSFFGRQHDTRSMKDVPTLPWRSSSCITSLGHHK
jgi:hypothetical protein